jgi:hypothetical protein
MNTPWGKSDSIEKIQRGVSRVGTPSHGGLMITRKAAETFLSSAAIKRAETFGENYLAFEQDCLASIVLWEHANDVWAERFFNDRYGVQQLFESISRGNPDYLLEIGIEPAVAQYAEWKNDRETDALRAARSPELIIAAWGNWADWVPAGQVGVATAAGTRFLLDNSDYPKNGYRMAAYPNAVEVRQ